MALHRLTSITMGVPNQLWTPEDLEGARGLYSRGPPPPASFLHPRTSPP